MSRATKNGGARPITVGQHRLRWRIEWPPADPLSGRIMRIVVWSNSGGTPRLLAEQSNMGGHLPYVPYKDSQITPLHVAEIIRHALMIGWNPRAKGPDFRLPGFVSILLKKALWPGGWDDLERWGWSPNRKREFLATLVTDYDLGSSDPTWSSGHLERWVASFLDEQQGAITELFLGLDLVLKTGYVRLTASVAHLIQDVGRLAFARYRDAYDHADWTWAEGELAGDLSPARAYLFLRILPVDRTTPDVAAKILRALEGTPQFAEAAATLADDLKPSAVPHARG